MATLPPDQIVIDARSATRTGGGIGNYVRSLLQHMLPLTSFRWLLLRAPDDDLDVPVLDHVTQLTVPGATKSPASLATLVRRVGSSLERAALYHCPAEVIPLGLRLPWVVTCHDLMWLERPRLASGFAPARAVNGLWYRANYDRALKGARRIIAISQATADAVSRNYPSLAPRTSVVRHGVDLRRFNPSAGGERASLPLKLRNVDRFSLMVGQGSPYKNHLSMVRAFLSATAGQTQHKLVLVRRFSRVDVAMNGLLKSAEARSRVVVLPFVEEATLLTLFRHAHMFLFASHYEGFGMPALEAMAMGAPVLGSTTPAVAEVVGSAGLLARPDDPTHLRECVTRLDTDYALRKRLTAAGKERVARFKWSKAAQQTVAVYQRALATAPTLRDI